MNNPIKPDHYVRSGMSCMGVIRLFVMGCTPTVAFMMGNVVKYLWRWQGKNGVEDLRKAREYLDMMIKELEG